jgi:hypothetical protein
MEVILAERNDLVGKRYGPRRQRYDGLKISSLSFMLHVPQRRVQSNFLVERPPEMAQRVFREYRPRVALASVTVEFRRFANVNSTVRFAAGELRLRISDLLEGAPPPVLEALFHLLIGKMFRYEVPAAYAQRYRRHVESADFRRTAHLVRQERGRKIMLAPQGNAYDLDAIFEQLNQEFFHGLMARPQLGWSARRSRRLLGHYDPSHNAIVLSRLLDAPSVPRLVVEYVLFHEMLHLRFPVKHGGARRSIHPKEFKEAERQFPRLAEALALLKQLDWVVD